MELYEIKNGLEDARLLLDQLYVSANIEVLKREIEGLTVQTMDEHFWDDQAHATKVYAHLNEMKKVADTDDSLEASYKELVEVYEYVKDTEDPDFMASLEEDYIKFQKNLDEFEKTLLFDQEYDHSNAIVEIHPGAGGTESQDWAEMLMRMYIRYGEKKGWKVDVDDYLAGDEAGLKSCSIRFTGYNAYGHLRAEKGVHRLVRISPFDSSKRRHTSFASVEVSPELDDDIEITIDPKDLRIDTYRASGAGGQHINKTSSAIRITHYPTGIVVQCQNERSQHMNKDKAMQMLKAKLYLLQKEEQEREAQGIRGEVTDIGWGNQIRSYVLQPYTMVKDLRTGEETGNVDAVLDGEITPFMNAYLKWCSLGCPDRHAQDS